MYVSVCTGCPSSLSSPLPPLCFLLPCHLRVGPVLPRRATRSIYTSYTPGLGSANPLGLVSRLTTTDSSDAVCSYGVGGHNSGGLCLVSHAI